MSVLPRGFKSAPLYPHCGPRPAISQAGKQTAVTNFFRNSEKRHGNQSEDRSPLSLEDYLLVPYIIKERDKVEMSPQRDVRHRNRILIYTKQIGDTYYYVEEVRMKNKSLAFKSLRKRKTKSPS